MIDKRFTPSDSAIAAIILMYSNLDRTIDAEKVYEDFLTRARHSKKPTEKVFSAMLNMYLKTSNIPKAEQIFVEALNLEVSPTEPMFTKIIGLYARIFDADKVETAYRRMADSELAPTEPTFFSILNMYCILENREKAAHYFFEMRAKSVPISRLTSNKLIDLFKTKDLKVCEEIFDYMTQQCEIHPTAITLTTMMQAYTMHGKFEKSEHFFAKFSEYGIALDSTAYSVMIQAYCGRNEGEDLDRAEALLEQMLKEKSVPTYHTFHLMIQLYISLKKYTQVEQLHQKIIDFGFTSTSSGLSCLLIEMYEELDKVEKAESLFQEMLDKNISPPHATYDTMIKLYTRARMPEKANSIFKIIKKRRGAKRHTFEAMIEMETSLDNTRKGNSE